jgi:hypothetical protein
MANGFKSGGRTIGSKNLVANPIREVLKEALNSELINIQSYLNELDTKDKLEAIIKMLPYCVSKLATEVIVNEQLPTRFDFDIEVIENVNDKFVVTETYKSSMIKNK